jgi:YVTN family beta-propeller protein
MTADTTIAVGREPIGIAIDQRTGRVFTADARSDQVGVIDIRSGSVIASIPVGSYPRPQPRRDGPDAFQAVQVDHAHGGIHRVAAVEQAARFVDAQPGAVRSSCGEPSRNCGSGGNYPPHKSGPASDSARGRAFAALARSVAQPPAHCLHSFRR